jgi:hypothetical protein
MIAIVSLSPAKDGSRRSSNRTVPCSGAEETDLFVHAPTLQASAKRPPDLDSLFCAQLSLGYFILDIAMMTFYYPSLGGFEYVSPTLSCFAWSSCPFQWNVPKCNSGLTGLRAKCRQRSREGCPCLITCTNPSFSSCAHCTLHTWSCSVLESLSFDRSVALFSLD